MADAMGICAACGGLIGYVNAPTGGWWAHDQHPEDNHDAVPQSDRPSHESNPEADPEPIFLRDGTELTEERIAELVAEAERGYDIPHKHSRRWPPPERGGK